MNRSLSSMLLASFLVASTAFSDELPPCTARNIGQCVNNQVCSNTPMGPGWMSAAEAEDCAAALPKDAPLDKPGTSVYLKAGWGAPYEGHLVSLPETKRRAKKEVNEAGTLSGAQSDGVLLPKPVFAAVIAGVIVVLAGGIAATVCAETHCIPGGAPAK